MAIPFQSISPSKEYMTVSKEVQPTILEEEFRICPACGANRGFHISFVRKENEIINIVLICPECGKRYSVDWNIEIQKK